MNVRVSSIEFCNVLSQKFRAISDLRVRHVSDYGELLPHVFLADVTRHLLTTEKGRMCIVRHLEDCFASCGCEIENLIAVSFLENLGSLEELEQVTRGVETPRLCAEWRSQRST